MTETMLDVPPEVVAAHEAGHVVAVIVFGGAFEGLALHPGEVPIAEVTEVGGLSDLGWARMIFAGSAGEMLAIGTVVPAYAEQDKTRLGLISDWRVLAFADPEALKLLQKYQPAFDAIRELILERALAQQPDLIPAAELKALAAIHGAPFGVEENPN